jgi:16S rRNA (guanine(966)-N(2))-methyltransferase RsmD
MGGTLRISGGTLGGRTIQVPPGVIRPAMDRMRESVFAVLGDLSGASFLDFFSGSGIIALEAASRGASLIEAVESDPAKRKTLISNVSLSPVRINCHFIASELYIKRSRRSFDFIFCDPPFSYKHKKELITSIEESALLAENTLLLVHYPKTEAPDWGLARLALRETRLYGASAVDFFYVKK